MPWYVTNRFLRSENSFNALFICSFIYFTKQEQVKLEIEMQTAVVISELYSVVWNLCPVSHVWAQRL